MKNIVALVADLPETHPRAVALVSVVGLGVVAVAATQNAASSHSNWLAANFVGLAGWSMLLIGASRSLIKRRSR